MTPQLPLSRARELALLAQGLDHSARTATPAPQEILERLGCIQLDTIQVVRRSHELVLLARGADAHGVRTFVDHARPADYFEYWAHAASIVPLALWPHFAFRRRKLAEHGWNGPTVDPDACNAVRLHIDTAGAATISDLGGAQGTGWDRSSPYKWAAEWLLTTGELVCVRRRGWKRVYEPAHTALPQHLLTAEPDDHDCIQYLSELALKAQGIATTADVADYFRMPQESVQAALTTSAIATPVEIATWKEPAWVWAPALEIPAPDLTEAAIPLSPFDSLLWHRPRMRQLFGVDYLLEAYKPAAQRLCGYFGMPVLAQDRIAGRIALRVDKKRQIIVEGIQYADTHSPAVLSQALTTAATWGGADLENEATLAALADAAHVQLNASMMTP